MLRDCLDTGTPASWEKFIRLAQPVIASAIVRTLNRWGGERLNVSDDLIQDTFLQLCAKDFRVLRNFRAGETNSLYAYLRTIASSTVIDYLNSLSNIKNGGGIALLSIDAPGTGAGVRCAAPHREIEKNLLLRRIENCLAEFRDRDRQIFWLYHRHGFSPEAISAYPGIAVGKGGVETILYRLTKVVRDCVTRGVADKTAGGGVGA